MERMTEPGQGSVRRAGGAVVVTGASTGIGRATALHLDSLGFEVFAGVRREPDGERLASEAAGELTPIILDVTDGDSIEAAARRVAEAVHGAGLRGLVNNAGVAQPAPIEVIPIDALREQLEVNVVGQVAVTQAMLPELRRARGRIVNLSSIGGLVASPALGAYSASKFAIEALSDSLRMELAAWGIHVSVIEPGSIRTELWRRGLDTADSTLERIPQAQRDLYAGLISSMRRLAERTESRAITPERVAGKIAHALTAARPRTRYLVGADARIQATLARLLPDRAYDSLVRLMLRSAR
jgi:NAD(P)-dependent dehydrogenase (short-subunit alcohol dehydrogenase family)